MIPMLRFVALRKESVDRNFPGTNTILYMTVALRKESVDRNICQRIGIRVDKVALRKESVDRNCQRYFIGYFGCRRSPQGERG